MSTPGRADVQELVRFWFERPDTADAAACLAAYFTELDRRLDGHYEQDGCGAQVADDYTPPGGAFVVVRLDGRAIGCGALRTLEPGVGEIKRMWISPAHRGHGLGLRLLETLEAVARRSGLRVVRLDSTAELHEAVELYRRSGYRSIPRYNDNVHATVWLEKTLEPAA